MTRPPFRADHVGNLLRPRHLIEARERRARGELSALALHEIENEAIRHIVRRQAVCGRLAGYEAVNDAARLARDPAMRAIVGCETSDRPAASTSRMGGVETEWLAMDANLVALPDLSGVWIDRVHGRKPPDGITLDLDSTERPG